MALDLTRVRHPEAGEANVPTSLVDHYAQLGWEPAALTENSTADRPSTNAPEGAPTASQKEGSE